MRATRSRTALLRRHRLEPIGPVKEGSSSRSIRRREPVRPLPSRLGAIDRAFFPEEMIERAAPDAARALMLQPGIVDLVVMTVELDGAGIHECRVLWWKAKRRTSSGQRSRLGAPSTIHSAIIRPAPPPAAMP